MLLLTAYQIFLQFLLENQDKIIHDYWQDPETGILHDRIRIISAKEVPFLEITQKI